MDVTAVPAFPFYYLVSLEDLPFSNVLKQGEVTFLMYFFNFGYLFKEIGYFGINDEPFARNYGEDYEMVLKISEKYRIGRVWDPIYDVVRHSGGTDHSIDQSTIDRNDEAKDFMREQAIQRRIKMNQ